MTEHDEETPSNPSEEKAASCPPSSQVTSHQIDILENNFRFYHAWAPYSFTEYDDRSYWRDDGDVKGNTTVDDGNVAGDSILVSGLPSDFSTDTSSRSIADLFSAFGLVSKVELRAKDRGDETVALVVFEDGSDGAQRTIDSQPITMFGKVLTIELEKNENPPFPPKDKPNNLSITQDQTAPFPLIVSPPNHGPWYQKPPQKSYLKPCSSAPPKINTMGKWAKLMTDKFNPPSTEVVSPGKQSPSPATKKQASLIFQRKHSSSLHTLLSPIVRDPLFDDDHDVMDESSMHPDARSSEPKTTEGKYLNCDDALPSWVWAPVLEDGASSMAERELYNTLKLGRGSHAKLSLLAMVSGPTAQTDGDESLNFLEQTNLNALYKATDITVTDISMANKVGSYTLYQARHPCLAPLISVTECFDSSIESRAGESSPMESFVSVFDITPSRHRPLHELLRTGDFLRKPLYPGVEGHVGEEECRDRAGFRRKKNSDPKSPLAWFNGGGDDQGLCRCHKLFDRGRGAAPQFNLLQRERNFRAELRQFTSSTSTMFSMLAEQEIFDDLRKMHLLPPSSHHPQLYSRFNQTRMLYRVGSAYHADVADLRIRFLALQLFHAVNFLHSKGITLGDQLRPDRIFVEDDDLWLRLVVPIESTKKNVYVSRVNGSVKERSHVRAAEGEITSPASNVAKSERRAIFDRYGSEHDSQGINTEEICQLKAAIVPYPGYGLLPCAQWQNGLLTNFAYLMMINAAAGRTVGDQLNPPIFPWVTDFTSKIDLESERNFEQLAMDSPWRDLTKSKYRLHKGDEQLDQSFMHTSPAHHVPETISDLTYTVYRARCLPLIQLQAKVRNQFIPQHYPETLERLYAWTPDEATYEFYLHSRPNIFMSRHPEMNNLSLPEWCDNDPEMFISYHRRLLESDQVSQNLHSWIDLNFGVALSGERAVLEKNVVLHHVQWNCVNLQLSSEKEQCSGQCHSPLLGDNHTDHTDKRQELHQDANKSVFVQLFLRPHPNRLEGNSTSLVQPRSVTTPHLDHAREFLLRKQRDLSMIGAIISECYSSAKVIPPPDVQEAIDHLLSGTLDIKQSLRNADEKDDESEKVIFPFPASFSDTYNFLTDIQSATFTRYQLIALNCSDDITSRSTDLDKDLATIKNPRPFGWFSRASLALVLPVLLAPMRSTGSFMENYNLPRPYPSFAERLCDYVLQLSRLIPGELMSQLVFRFLVNASRQANGNTVITEAISKLYLSQELISRMYDGCLWEQYIQQISKFVISQLCHFSTTKELPKSTNQLHMKSITVFSTNFLAHDGSLGTSVCCRYIVPLLINHIEECSVSNNGNLSIQAIRGLAPFLPEKAVAAIIVKPVLKKLACYVSGKQSNGAPLSPSGGTSVNTSHDLLRDLISLLHLCLSQMDSELAVKYFFQSNTSGCIQQVILFSFDATISVHRGSIQSKQLLTPTGISVCEDECRPEDVLKGACLLVVLMISKFDMNSICDNLLPIVEALCSLANDEFLAIPLKQSIDWNNEGTVHVLPGIDDACMIAKEAVRVCDESLLKHYCPSALELLSLFTSPGQPASKAATSNKKFATMVSSVSIENANDVKDNALDDYSSDGLLFSSSLVTTGEEAIEMLVPKRALTDDTDDSEFEEVSLSNRESNSDGDIRLMQQRSVHEPPPLTLEEQYHLTKQTRDLAWVMGLHRLDGPQIKYCWQPRMMATTSLPVKTSSANSNTEKGAITSMAPNKSENLLAAGNSGGDVLLYDLRRHPPVLSKHHHFGHSKAVAQVAFFNANSVLACNGGLHLWDVETGTVSSTTPHNTFLNEAAQRNRPWKNDELLCFSIFSSMTSCSEIIYGSYREIAAISSKHLYMIDVRCSDSVGHQQVFQPDSMPQQQIDPIVKHLSWFKDAVSASSHSPSQKKRELNAQISSFNLKCITTYCGGGDWICVGSSSGHIHCFCRRQSKLLFCWKAHTKSIEYLQAVSRHLLLSASADKTAVLWNLASNLPKRVSSIYNIPGKEGTMNIATHQLQDDGLVSIPNKQGNLILCAAAGRKAVFQPMPMLNGMTEEAIEVKAERIVMSDYKGSYISSSSKFDIHSIALLPCHQLVLLGCEDSIHVCL